MPRSTNHAAYFEIPFLNEATIVLEASLELQKEACRDFGIVSKSAPKENVSASLITYCDNIVEDPYLIVPDEARLAIKDPFLNLEIWVYKDTQFLLQRRSLIMRTIENGVSKSSIVSPLSSAYGFVRSEIVQHLRMHAHNQGIPLLHAGLMMNPSTNRGMLVLGEKGMGKTSICLHLLEAGWLFASDELVFLEVTTSAVTARGVPRRPTLDPNSQKQFSNLHLGTTHLSPLNADSKTFVMLDSGQCIEALTQIELHSILLPQFWHYPGSYIESVTNHQTFNALRDASENQLGSDLSKLQWIAAKIPSCRFLMGHDIDQRRLDATMLEPYLSERQADATSKFLN